MQILMKIKKRILCPERLRRIPGQFSWVDQRLVRDRYLHQCDHGALSLYLVLVTVSDVDGLRACLKSAFRVSQDGRA